MYISKTYMYFYVRKKTKFTLKEKATGLKSFQMKNKATTLSNLFLYFTSVTPQKIHEWVDNGCMFNTTKKSR